MTICTKCSGGAGFNKKMTPEKRHFAKFFSDPDWIQTNDLLLRRQLLYSAELPGRKSLPAGFIQREMAAKVKKNR